MKREMENNLNGMYWDSDKLNYKIPHAGSAQNSIFIFQKDGNLIDCHNCFVFSNVKQMGDYLLTEFAQIFDAHHFPLLHGQRAFGDELQVRRQQQFVLQLASDFLRQAL